MKLHDNTLTILPDSCQNISGLEGWIRTCHTHVHGLSDLDCLRVQKINVINRSRKMDRLIN